jgi:NitT/TauT family transport system substrate-binding protein
MKKKLVMVCVLIIGMLFVNGALLFAEGQQEETGVVKLKMATSAQDAFNVTNLKMIEIAATKGLEIELIEHSGGSKTAQSVLAREVQFGQGGLDETIISVSNGAPLQAFAPASQPRINYVLIGKGNIKSLKDLVGKNVGISGTAGFDSITARMAFQNNGIDPDSVNWTQIGGSSARAQSLVAGKVDAVNVFLPNWIQLMGMGDFSLVTSMGAMLPDVPNSVYIARSDWLKENVEVAQKIAESIIEAQQWAYNNKDEWVADAMAYLADREQDVVELTYDEYKKMGMFAVDGGLSKTGSQKLVQLLIQSGDIKEELPIENVLNMEVLGPFILD